MKCPKCDYENKDDAVYCGLCYEVLKKEKIESQTPALPPAQTPKVSKKSYKKFWTLLEIILGLFVLFYIISSEIIQSEYKPPPQPDISAQLDGDFGKGSVETVKGEIGYQYFIPNSVKGKKGIPVLLLLSGSNKSWMDFMKKYGLVMVTLIFPFDMDEWYQRKSYQFPEVWSGEVLLKILDRVAEKADIDKSKLYLTGFSGTAQFSYRFALWKPDLCAAVAAHAFGSTTLPTKRIPTKFLITVGSEDKDRHWNAESFYEGCRRFGIDAELKIYQGIGHELSQQQIEDSMTFFIKALESRR